MKNRRGFTLVELLIALALGVALFAVIVEFHGRSIRQLESDQRKMGAWRNVHIASERLRQALFPAAWMWVVPLGKKPDPTGSHLMYAGVRPGGLLEIAFDPAERRLFIGGKPVEVELTDVRFLAVGLGRVKCLIWEDQSKAGTGLPAERERAALVTEFLAPEMAMGPIACGFELARRRRVDGVHSGIPR